MKAVTPASERAGKSILRRLVRVGVIFFLTPYLLIVVAVTVGQRSLIYHPKREATLNTNLPSPRGGTIEPVSIKAADGVELHGWYITRTASTAPGVADSQRKNGKPVALYFCGNANHRGARIDEFELFLEAGADAVCFDYRGYGDNAGSPSEESIAADARDIWRFLIDERKISPAQIVICGESLGGGVATRLASDVCTAETPPGGLLLRSTFTRLTDAGAVHFPWLPVRMMAFDRFPSIERISRVTCPILILHGEQDSIVPFELGQALFAAAPPESSQGIDKRFLSLPLADHNDVLWSEGAKVGQGIREFLDTINPVLPAKAESKKSPSNAMFTDLVRKLTYFPDRAADLSPEALRLPRDRIHSVEFKTDDGLTLNGWHLLAEGRSAPDSAAWDRELATGRPVVLFFSGNGGNRAYRTPESGILTRAGADVFLFDYRGYGDNAGEPSERALAADALSLWNYATNERQIAPGRIILYGESLGGAVATRLAAELCRAKTPPAGLVLRSTFSALADVARHHYPLLPIKLLLDECYASVEQISDVTCPILMLHGQHDTIVPNSLGRKLFDEAPQASSGGIAKRFVDLPHADHNDVLETDRETLETAIKVFIEGTSNQE